MPPGGRGRGRGSGRGRGNQPQSSEKQTYTIQNIDKIDPSKNSNLKAELVNHLNTGTCNQFKGFNFTNNNNQYKANQNGITAYEKDLNTFYNSNDIDKKTKGIIGQVKNVIKNHYNSQNTPANMCVLDITKLNSLKIQSSQGSSGSSNNQQDTQEKKQAREKETAMENARKKRADEKIADEKKVELAKRRDTNINIIIGEFDKMISIVNSKRASQDYTIDQKKVLIELLLQIGLPTVELVKITQDKKDSEKNIKVKNELFNNYLLESRNYICNRLLSAASKPKSSDIKNIRAAYEKIEKFEPLTDKEIKETIDKQQQQSDQSKDSQLRNAIKSQEEQNVKNTISQDKKLEVEKNEFARKSEQQQFEKKQQQIESDKQYSIINEQRQADYEKLEPLDTISQTQPVTQQPVTQQPAIQQPVTQQPVTQQPVTQQPVEQQPVAQQPAQSDVNEKIAEDKALAKQIEQDKILLLKKEEIFNKKIRDQELREEERIIELELINRKIKDKRIELKDKLSDNITFDILPSKKDFENTIVYLKNLKLSYIVNSEKSSHKGIIVVRITKYLKLIKNNDKNKIIQISDKGKPINDILPKIIKIHIKHKTNLIKIIANRNLNNKVIHDHLSELPVNILNHYYDFIVLLLNHPQHMEKCLQLLIQ